MTRGLGKRDVPRDYGFINVLREVFFHLADDLETTKAGIYAAGDVTGIEEASSAMVEGKIAGYSAAASLGHSPEEAARLRQEAMEELRQLRSGPTGGKINAGIEKVKQDGGVVHVNLYRYSH